MKADDGESIGRFHTEWYGEGHNVYVERELYAIMELRPRQ